MLKPWRCDIGNYASQAELQTRFEDTAEVEFLTDKAEASGVDTDVLDDVIEAAEAEIDSALSKRFATPVTITGNVPLTALLKRKTLDLAEHYLHRRGEDESEIKRVQAERVLEWLDKLVAGERNLVGAVTVASTTSADPRGTWTSSNRELPDTSARRFTRETGARL